MKKIILFGALVFISAVTYAQTVLINGTVNDAKGKPIPFAFISDVSHPYGAFSDQNGSFTIKIASSSTLAATATGFKDTQVKTDNSTDVKIVMETGESGPSTTIQGTQTLTDVFKPKEEITDMVSNSLTMKGSGQEAMHGNKYLFDQWVHGFAVTPKDSIKQSNVYLFNYDKVLGDLIFTRNMQTAITVDKNEIKGFTLFDDNVQPYVFESVPSIDDRHYVQVLSSGSKYKIYKNLGTKFIKANYTTNGITSYGNNYDEYKDESTYYLVRLPDGKPVKFDLRRKSIKTAFAADADKVSKFLSDNDKDIDDDYLKSLSDYINQ